MSCEATGQGWGFLTSDVVNCLCGVCRLIWAPTVLATAYWAQNGASLYIYVSLCFSGRLRLRRKEVVTRIRNSCGRKRNQRRPLRPPVRSAPPPGAGGGVAAHKSHPEFPCSGLSDWLKLYRVRSHVSIIRQFL